MVHQVEIAYAGVEMHPRPLPEVKLDLQIQPYGAPFHVSMHLHSPAAQNSLSLGNEKLPSS